MTDNLIKLVRLSHKEATTLMFAAFEKIMSLQAKDKLLDPEVDRDEKSIILQEILDLSEIISSLSHQFSGLNKPK